MIKPSRLSRSVLYLAMSAGLAPLAVAQNGPIIEEIIVTAQRKAESIQDVPVAVSAFSANDLTERRLDDGRDLQTAVPNLTYTGTGAGGGEGFQIRGVGNSVGGTTGDVGVGIHHNNAPQVQSRIATAESYDMERIEILRGPQGTLYGRNSTGGVINYITAKPVFEEFDVSLTGEVGSYNTQKVKGMVNIPMGDTAALRIAGTSLERDGFTDNITTGNDVDNRDIWSARATLAIEPTEWLSAWFLYERFGEDDSRGSGRTLCIKDEGPTQIGSTPVNAETQNFLSQGCAAGSIYSDEAFGNPHSVGTFGGRFANYLNYLGSPALAAIVPIGDLYAAQTLPNDLRTTSAYRDPSYDVEQEIIEFEINADITDSLTLSFLGHSSEDISYTQAGSYEGTINFGNSFVTPGGVYTDFQQGAATGMRTLSINDYQTEQTSLELRLQSALDGPINFNLGFLDFQVDRETHTWVSTNTTTIFVTATQCPGGVVSAACALYYDQNATPDYSGHQYFDTYTPYELDSQALFGELYWDITDTVKFTAGLRYTDDDKRRIAYTPALLNPQGADLDNDGIGDDGAPGYAPENTRNDQVDFQATTGRFVLDWMPETSFTDSTLVYGSFSRGYKSGGFNSPDVGQTTNGQYDPEYVDAYEFGTKNTFAGGRAILNASLFYYDYQDYQISKLEGFSSRNENIDAEVYGLELEGSFEFFDSFEIGGTLGWLETKIKSGESIDPIDRTNGDSTFTVLQGYQIGCIAPTAQVEAAVAAVNLGVPPTIFFNSCDLAGSLATGIAPFFGPIDITPGIAKDLTGNQLPNAPSLSAGLNLRYRWEMAGWNSSAILDYSWKDDAYTSVFNSESYELESWDNANFSLNFANYDVGLTVQAYVKNIFDDDTIVNYAVGSDGVGLTRGISLLDPRTYGLAVTYNFD
ncbi:TonB-dependent receptor [Aurantivibrio plasticivorans]